MHTSYMGVTTSPEASVTMSASRTDPYRKSSPIKPSDRSFSPLCALMVFCVRPAKFISSISDAFP